MLPVVLIERTYLPLSHPYDIIPSQSTSSKRWMVSL